MEKGESCEVNDHNPSSLLDGTEVRRVGIMESTTKLDGAMPALRGRDAAPCK